MYDAANENYTLKNWSSIEYFDSPDGMGAILFADLPPGTTYHYTILFLNSPNLVVPQTGTFRTLDRRVSVEVTKLRMYDDSDDLGAGEFTIGFHMRTESDVKVATDLASLSSIILVKNQSIHTGHILHDLGHSTTIHNEDTIRFDVSAMEDDWVLCDPFCSGKKFGGWPDNYYFGNGDDSYRDQEYGSKYRNIGLKQNAFFAGWVQNRDLSWKFVENEDFSESRTLRVLEDDSAMAYKVWYTFDVTHE